MRKHVKNTTPKHFSGLPGEMGEFQIQNRGKNMKVDLSFVTYFFLGFWAEPSGC